MLAAVGGLVGMGVAWADVAGLLSLAPANLPRLDTVGLDWNVFGFALVATAIASFVFALVPAVRSTRLTCVTGRRW